MSPFLIVVIGLTAAIFTFLLLDRPQGMAARFSRYADDVPEEALAPGWWEGWRGRSVHWASASPRSCAPRPSTCGCGASSGLRRRP